MLSKQHIPLNAGEDAGCRGEASEDGGQDHSPGERTHLVILSHHYSFIQLILSLLLQLQTILMEKAPIDLEDDYVEPVKPTRMAAIAAKAAATKQVAAEVEVGCLLQ